MFVIEFYRTYHLLEGSLPRNFVKVLVGCVRVLSSNCVDFLLVFDPNYLSILVLCVDGRVFLFLVNVGRFVNSRKFTTFHVLPVCILLKNQRIWDDFVVFVAIKFLLSLLQLS